jgi:hypothetical protein
MKPILSFFGKKFLLLLILSFPLFTFSQITTPIIKAGFGVDADTRARFFNGGLQTSDDWFLLSGTPGTPADGEFVIDTTGAAAILAGYLTDISPWPRRMATFVRRMSKPEFSVVNSRLWLDAVFVRDYHGSDSTVFTAGSDKNGMSPALWTGGIQGVPDKNDILDMFVHVRREGSASPDSLWMFGGISLDNTTGNRYFDFEMYQSNIYYDKVSRKFSGYGPDAGHTSWKFDASGNIITPGDIIFNGEFQSGTLTAIEARIWVKKTDWQTVVPTSFNWSGLFDGDGAGAVYGYASISPKTVGAFYTGLGSAVDSWAGPFGLVLQDNSLSYINPAPASATNSKFIADQFIEFSVNLTKLGLDPVTLLGGDICGHPFKGVVVKTRASASFTSELKDFIAPTDMFIAPRVAADADMPIFCGDTASISHIMVNNPYATSAYSWTTPNGHIIGSPNGTSITVDSPGTYIVTQRLMAACAPYATDTVVITRVAHCLLLSGYIKSFNGFYHVENRNIRLDWAILNNENTSSFIVERSNNGIWFTPVKQINATQNPGEYVYSTNDDQRIINEKTVYYRIKMINSDGSYKFSTVITVVPGLDFSDGVVLTPNPARDYVQVNIQSSQNSLAEITIINQQGRVIKLFRDQVYKGNSMINIPNVATWQKGMYYMIVKMEDKVFHKKFVVIE